MELATIFLIWLVVVVIDNLSKRNKRRLPPPQNTQPDFDIPTLANDPNFPGEEFPIFIENPNQAEIRPQKFSQPKHKKVPKSGLGEEETKEFDLNLTPATVMDAFIINEILGKPKALRR